jgi:hypothetical protein
MVAIRLRRGLPAYGTGRYGSISTPCEFALQKMLHSAVVHHQHDDIGGLSADLEAKTATLNAHRRRRSPPHSGFIPAHGVTPAILAAYTDGAALHPWNDYDALGLTQKLFRNALFRCAHDLGENHACFLIGDPEPSRPSASSLLLKNSPLLFERA